MLWGRKKVEEPVTVPNKPMEFTRPAIPSGRNIPPISSRPTTPAAPALEKPAIPRDMLPQMLLQQGRVTVEQIQHALERQRETGDFIGEILVAEGILQEDSLLTFLAKQCKIPHLSLLDYLLDDEVVRLIPEAVCRKHRLIAVDRLGRNLTIAMVNPLDHVALEEVRALCPGLRIKPMLCTHGHFESVINRAFSVSRSALSDKTAPYAMYATREAMEKAHPAREPEIAAARPSGEAIDAFENEADLPEATPASSFDDAVIGSVFEETENSDDTSLEDSSEAPVTAEAVAMQMTTAMVASMRNTYGVLARRMELFRGVAPEDVARIFARGKVLEFPSGEMIFQKGDPGKAMYAILSGAVDVWDGERHLAHLDRGDMLGEMALVTRASRSGTARAATATTLLALSLDDIQRMLAPEISTQILINIIVTLSERLREANRG